MRLSPISTAQRPKQFIPLKDSQSLFEKTKTRFLNSEIYTKPIVIGNIAHRDLLKDTADENLVTLFEPIAILEKCSRLKSKIAQFDWSDLGSIEAMLPYLSQTDLTLSQGTPTTDTVIRNTC